MMRISAFALLLATLLTSCSVTRNRASERSHVDSSSLQMLKDSLSKERSEKEQYKAQLRQLEYAGVYFEETPCSPVPQADTTPKTKAEGHQSSPIQAAVNSVKIKPDGSVEASGPGLRKAFVSREIFLQMEKSWQLRIDSFASALSYTKTELEKSRKASEASTKKTGGGWRIFPILVFIAVCLAVGWYFRHRKRGWKLDPNQLSSKSPNMKMILLAILATILLTGCGPNKPDDKIHSTETFQDGWRPKGDGKTVEAVMKTTYMIKPTWGQAAIWAKQRGDHAVWVVIGIVLAIVAFLLLIGLAAEIGYTPRMDPRFAGILLFILIAGSALSFTWQQMAIKWNNAREIDSFHYHRLIEDHGSTKPYWDSLAAGCHLRWGPYKCYQK